MDQILACPSCSHAIGLHMPDGCQSRSRFSCDCVANAHDVIEAVLADDFRKREQMLSEPWSFRKIENSAPP